MGPAGKIIDIDAFKNKESGLKSTRSHGPLTGSGKPAGMNFVILLTVVVVSALSYLMIPARKGTIPLLPVGSIAPNNIKAPEEMLVKDKESTEKNMQKAREDVLDVYDFDAIAEKEVVSRVTKAFLLMTKGYRTHVESAYGDLIVEFEKEKSQNPGKHLLESKKAIADFEGSEAFANLESEFVAELDIEIGEKSINTLRYYHYWPKIGGRISAIVSPVFAKGIVARKSQLPASSAKGITMRFLSTGAVREIKNFDTIFDVPEAQRRVGEKVAEIISNETPAQRKLITTIAISLIQPNLTFNHKETDLQMDAAAKVIKPVFFKIQRGEMIIREGARVTSAHWGKLQSISVTTEDHGQLLSAIGTILFNLLLVTLAILFIKKYHEEMRESSKLQMLIASLLVAHMALVWATVNIFTIFIQQTPGISMQTYLLAAPLAFGPMIVSIFFTTELTVLFTIIASALTGLMLRDYPILALLTLTGGMVCAYNVRYYTKRSSVPKVGLMVAFVSILVVFAFEMIGSKSFFESQGYGVVFAFCGGILAALLVSGALPIMESMFPVVSDIKLLELTNLDHKLLRKMILEAPGTYHHSMMVGNLAEEACKSIEANALLARAGALFHDIGKMKKSDYFVENLRNQHNPHDKLTPSMSTLIVINHIKDGLEMARKHKLLPQIAKMIPEHHGTQLVKVFYHKAKQAEDASREEVREEDYRYPGPIPSSRESACVALADSIEAAARACKDPSVKRMRELVREVINDKFMQGQLDNSHLTLHDLAMITDSFTHVVSGMHHHRLAYPETAKEQEAANADSDPQTAQKFPIEGI